MLPNYNCPFPHRLTLFKHPFEYQNNLTYEFEPITAENVQAILQQAIWEFELLARNEAYSGYYFVDWRINFEPLEKYINANLESLPQWAALYFLTLHDNSADILYERLEIE